jgi:uncharacterized protein with GYD domain
MPTYVTLGKWTEQGIKTVKDAPKRTAAARAAMEKVGAKMTGFYITMGEYDFVAISEAPNDEVAMQVALTIGMQGNVRTTTMKAWPVEDASKVLARL